MYRIFCESYHYFLQSFDSDCIRVEYSKPFQLIVHPSQFEEEKKKESKLYQKLCDLVYIIFEQGETPKGQYGSRV